ncbi:MAG TPA: HlyD family efflux transporter periplasmic adaptor subunit [Thermoanaerobaculia bacterium]|nr:HlyD family efflux transporter periplasmic adaptor subunit [Thermoanaerobaculia bacterium]
MDIARPDRARKLRRRRILIGVAAVVALALGTVALSQLEPAAPSVERATVWIDQVKRGEMLRQVRGPGTLVPEEEQWISASSAGRVERVVVRPGTTVGDRTVLLELSNPELAQEALEAESEVRAAEADYRMLEAQLESQLLNQEGAAEALAADRAEADLQVEANERLASEQLIPELTLKISRMRAEQLARQQAIEGQRLGKLRASNEAQLAARRARLDQQRALWQLRQQQLANLRVVAGMDGVLQEVAVEPGQRVAPGTILAKVAQPDELKAELRIPETQARDVQVGQSVAVDTRNGVVPGRVARIDPAVREGTVTVDVALEGPLPRGARPDLSVDGTIEIERLDDVLYVGRPAFGQAGSRISLFRLSPDGQHAVRVPVALGRTSTNTVEIVDGLAEGERVILSDTSAWDGHDRIRLN